MSSAVLVARQRKLAQKSTDAIKNWNDPAAVARMYNYLVISGLFRSLSFLFVCCAWMELVQLFGAVWEEALHDNVRNDGFVLFRLAVFNGLFVFSMTSYIKFARRYVEEMLFALALRENAARQ
jgi:hypothetical protein